MRLKYSFICQVTSAGARAFKVGGSNLKVGQSFFIDFRPGNACRA